MTASKPPLPDGYELPAEVNGWFHDPESGKNGHAWYSADRETAVAVFSAFHNEVYAKASDERANGFARSVELFRDELHDVSREEKAEAVADAVDKAIDWMRETTPDQWSHPDVVEAVFDPPAGHVLERYYMEERETIVYYRRERFEKQVQGFADRNPDEYTVGTCPYLYIHVWNGSGNATVAIAPWLRAHGPASKHPEIREVADPPEDCGLEVALKVAREWAAEEFGGDAEVSVGQSGLGQFSGGEQA